MTSVADLIDLWPIKKVLAVDLGVQSSHIRMMQHRGAIAVRYYQRMVASARRLGIPGVSIETIVDAHTPQGYKTP